MIDAGMLVISVGKARLEEAPRAGWLAVTNDLLLILQASQLMRS